MPHNEQLTALHGDTPDDASTIASLSSNLSQNGFAPTVDRLLSPSTCRRLRSRLPELFAGRFETGNYPDEWHWREGISRPDVAREICNAWKCDRAVATVVLSEKLGGLVARTMGWESVRVGQDDLIWKPPIILPSSHEEEARSAENNCSQRDSSGSPEGNQTVVGYHQDSAYISVQFEPYQYNSVTLWIALDDADEETGCMEYAVGSQTWRPLLHLSPEERGTSSIPLSRRIKKDTETSDNEKHDEGNSLAAESFHSANETTYRNGMNRAAFLANKIESQDDGARSTVVIKKVPVKEGHAILHHQDTWHGSGPNQSPSRHRRALVIHYLRGDIKFRNDRKMEGDGSSGPPSNDPPWGAAGYIYGRYKRHGSSELDESFFPIVYGPHRTEWLDGYILKDEQV